MTTDMLILYWTTTGNTLIMADCIAEGAKRVGVRAKTRPLGESTPAEALSAPRLALGCPAMGAEELEPTEFAPFWQALLPHIAGKKLALFGSYGWGGGRWLQNWEQAATAAGALVYRALAVPGRPDDAAMQLCEELGAGFARY